MKTTSSTVTLNINKSITQPGYLVELGFSSIIRLSTLGNIIWNSNSWSSSTINISGISQDGSATNSASIKILNTNNTYSAIILNDGASNIPVKIWSITSNDASQNIEDSILVFDGITDGADITETTVTLNLTVSSNSTLYSPRVRISKPVFNFLQPAKTSITWGNETFILERGR